MGTTSLASQTALLLTRCHTWWMPGRVKVGSGGSFTGSPPWRQRGPGPLDRPTRPSYTGSLTTDSLTAYGSALGLVGTRGGLPGSALGDG